MSSHGPITVLAVMTLAFSTGCGTYKNMRWEYPDPRPPERNALDPYGISATPGGRQIYGGTRWGLYGACLLAQPLKDPDALLRPYWLLVGARLLGVSITFVGEIHAAIAQNASHCLASLR